MRESRGHPRLLLWALAISTVGLAQDQSSIKASDSTVQVQMHNVNYHYTDTIAVRLINLGGQLLPTTPGSIPVFDDKSSFTLHIAAAEIAIGQQALADTLNTSVFASKDAPLKDISVNIEGGHLKLKGRIHKTSDIPFEIEGRVSATSNGMIRLSVDKIKALHVPVKGLMDLFGLDLADLIKAGKVRGVSVEKDDLILNPQELLPPPKIEGPLSQVRLQKGHILLIYGAPATYPWKQLPARNYMAYRGGRLQFGKLRMSDTDMILIDSHSKDPFDFYLDHYQEQLSAGYVKVTTAFGLRVFMTDFNKLN